MPVKFEFPGFIGFGDIFEGMLNILNVR